MQKSNPRAWSRPSGLCHVTNLTSPHDLAGNARMEKLHHIAPKMDKLHTFTLRLQTPDHNRENNGK